MTIRLLTATFLLISLTFHTYASNFRQIKGSSYDSEQAYRTLTKHAANELRNKLREYIDHPKSLNRIFRAANLWFNENRMINVSPASILRLSKKSTIFFHTGLYPRPQYISFSPDGNYVKYTRAELLMQKDETGHWYQTANGLLKLKMSSLGVRPFGYSSLIKIKNTTNRKTCLRLLSTLSALIRHSSVHSYNNDTIKALFVDESGKSCITINSGVNGIYRTHLIVFYKHLISRLRLTSGPERTFVPLTFNNTTFLLSPYNPLALDHIEIIEKLSKGSLDPISRYNYVEITKNEFQADIERQMIINLRGNLHPKAHKNLDPLP